MHPMHHHRERSDSICSPATDYAVLPSSSSFSALHLLRNYRFFGTTAGPAVAAAAAAAAAAADFVTNPRYELLHPHDYSGSRTIPFSYREYGSIGEGYERDSIPMSSFSERLLPAEDSASSSSPPVQQNNASSSSAASVNTRTISPISFRPEAMPLLTGIGPGSNSLVSAFHQSAFVNLPQQLPDSQSFAAETRADQSRRRFIGEAGLHPNCGSRRPRSEKRPIPDEQKDDKYYERRKRNNQAAKKSRDARKIREDHIALRARMLEHENAILRTRILGLREEAHSLRRMLIEQQMPKLQGRYSINCPRSGHSSTTRPTSSNSNVTVTSAAPDSSSNGMILFSHASPKVPTT